MVVIRPLQRSDNWAIKNFECASREDPTYQRQVQKMVRKQLLEVCGDRSRNLVVQVAVEAGKLCGVVVTERADDVDLVLVAVNRDSRRKGIATSLMTHALSNYATEGASYVSLEVHKQNDGMRRLLGECGDYFPNDLDDEYEVFVTEVGTLLQELSGIALPSEALPEPSLILG